MQQGEEIQLRNGRCVGVCVSVPVERRMVRVGYGAYIVSTALVRRTPLRAVPTARVWRSDAAWAIVDGLIEEQMQSE